MEKSRYSSTKPNESYTAMSNRTIRALYCFRVMRQPCKVGTPRCGVRSAQRADPTIPNRSKDEALTFLAACIIRTSSLAAPLGKPRRSTCATTARSAMAGRWTPRPSKKPSTPAPKRAGESSSPPLELISASRSFCAATILPFNLTPAPFCRARRISPLTELPAAKSWVCSTPKG